jgi:26S proteasome regulatory subunit N1
MNAIFSLGLVSAGTNHSRLSGHMRQLAAYYSEDTNPLMILRISQGLLHLGKGLITINPVHSHKFITNHVGLAGLLISVLSFTEAEPLICGKHQHLIYSLCLSMTPRMVMTVFLLFYLGR